MPRVTLTERHLPLAAFKVTRLHSKVEALGFFLPMRHDMGPMLVDGTGGSLVVIPLEGDRAFNRMSLHIGTTIEGMLFPDTTIAVDVTSRINPHSEGQRGDLSLGYGKVHLLSVDPRPQWGNVEPFPLQLEVEMDSDSPVAFRRWSVLVDDGDTEVELWRNYGILPADPDDEEE